MPEIKGFKGWRYNASYIKDLSKVFAPPYDVISKKDQEGFHKKHPQNVIRLILGKELAGDGATDNKYTRAKKFLEAWTSEGVLLQDSRPAVYVYAQDYKEAGRMKTRIGFIAAMKINEKEILKHENTLAAPKKDRFSLISQVRTNLSPIWGLFEDKKAVIQKVVKQSLSLRPCADVTIDGVRHRLYLEDRTEQVQKLSDAMRKHPMFIADGHHRFEVACQFKNWMRTQDPRAEDPSWGYVMTYFSDCFNNPLTIYPTHRLVNFPRGMASSLDSLKKHGSLEPVKSLKVVLERLKDTREAAKTKKYAFGVYTKKEGFFIFTLNSKETKRVKNNPVDRLDVAVLHKAVIEPCFKIKKIEKSPDIDFTRNADEAVTRVKAGEFGAAFFLRPTSLNEMLLASKKGLKMPQKSTYFYPKLLSGLVFHRFENGAA